MVKTEPMTHLECLATICELAQSQGFYGRLRENLHDLQINDPLAYADIMADWDNHGFKDELDFILYLEQ